MAKAFSFLFVILSYSSYLSIAIEVDPTPEEWVNPWDMTKYDAAAKTIDHGVSFFHTRIHLLPREDRIHLFSVIK